MWRRGFATLVAALLMSMTVPGTLGALTPQDDAGSGQDAPDEPVPEVWIQSGHRYEATTEGGLVADGHDHFAFHADAGDEIVARAAGTLASTTILSPDGSTLSEGNTVGRVEMSARGEATQTGTHYLVYRGLGVPDRYSLSLGVNEEAPDPAPVNTRFKPQTPGPASLSPATQTSEHAVVAVVDTGINPYHELFRAPSLTDHPATWLEGFPTHAESVELSLDASSYDAAVEADAATWESLAYSGSANSTGIHDAHLYTFPGTRVVAAISFGELDAANSFAEQDTPVLDEDGHGTGSAGLAVGNGLDHADGDVLVVAIEADDPAHGIWWAAQQPWIDAISISLGALLNGPFHDLGSEDSQVHATRAAADAGQAVLAASGNGWTTAGDVHCQTWTSPYLGPSWVTRIGAAEPWTGNPSTWHCLPVDATGRTPAPSASATSMDAPVNHTGTSAATPNVAGHLANLLVDAREAGLETGPRQALDHLLHAAQRESPGIGIQAEPPLPGSAHVIQEGYGLVDAGAVERALATLQADDGPQPRPGEDAFFAHESKLRAFLWGPDDGALTDPFNLYDRAWNEMPDENDVNGIQDDAGSGQDAPDQPPSDVVVAPDRPYTGILDAGIAGDWADVYALELEAGETVTFAHRAQYACVEVWTPRLEPRGSPTCSVSNERTETSFVADEGGTWYVEVDAGALGTGAPFRWMDEVPNAYTFGYGVDGPAPSLLLAAPGLPS